MSEHATLHCRCHIHQGERERSNRIVDKKLLSFKATLPDLVCPHIPSPGTLLQEAHSVRSRESTCRPVTSVGDEGLVAPLARRTSCKHTSHWLRSLISNSMLLHSVSYSPSRATAPAGSGCDLRPLCPCLTGGTFSLPQKKPGRCRGLEMSNRKRTPLTLATASSSLL